jgi:hypothetical protein
MYEFEDTIRTVDVADMLAPVRVPRGRLIRRLRRAVGRQADDLFMLRPPTGRKYDLLLLLAHHPADLRYLEQLRDVRDACQRSACFLEEMWSAEIDKWRAEIERVADFDAIFMPFASSRAALAGVLGRGCHVIPGGVDAAKFCPYPTYPVRSIDVYAMGRRPRVVHRALVRRAESSGLLYVYDTVSDFAVIDPGEHRALLANLIKRSRYFLAYRAKFDRPEETGGQEELGFRHFEGAAGGAILLGSAPRCDTYDQEFDWPDAVIPVSATDASEVDDAMATLERDPDRVARIRKDNVVNSLLRHDWLYRWRRMLDLLGLAPSEGMTLREGHLKRMADAVLHG